MTDTPNVRCNKCGWKGFEDDNPWVTAITFEAHYGNIDSMGDMK